MTNGKTPPQNLSQLPAFAKQALLHVVCASRGLFKEILLLFLAEAVKIADDGPPNYLRPGLGTVVDFCGVDVAGFVCTGFLGFFAVLLDMEACAKLLG